MTIPQQWENLIGLTAVDAEGDQIGRVGEVYLNDVSGEPEWVTVSTGMFGKRESFAPLYNSSVSDDQLALTVSKQLVKDAPSLDNDGSLSEAEISALYQYYGDHLAGDDGYTGRHADADETGVQGRDTSGPVTDDAMTRSEERLHVGTESAQVGRDAVLSGSDIGEEEHEVTLRAERPVVPKETVPVERVRLVTKTVTEEHQVEEQIRKEQIDEPEVDSRPGVG